MIQTRSEGKHPKSVHKKRAVKILKIGKELSASIVGKVWLQRESVTLQCYNALPPFKNLKTKIFVWSRFTLWYIHKHLSRHFLIFLLIFSDHNVQFLVLKGSVKLRRGLCEAGNPPQIPCAVGIFTSFPILVVFSRVAWISSPIRIDLQDLSSGS